MSVLFLIQFIIVLVCILLGAQAGGIGLGVFGGLGLAILTFGFGLEPTSPPIDVMLMMMAVVAAASAMQAAGGLDLMVKAATKLLRKNPKYITFMAPAVTYIFTIFAGTGHVAYSVLPVIAEVARRNGIRPERPLSMAVIASQFSIVASPIAAAVTSAVSYLTPYHLSIGQILIVTMPSTVLGIAIACIFVNKMGKELKDDPEYQRRLKDPAYQEIFAAQVSEVEMESSAGERSAKISLFIFICAAVLVVILGSSSAFRPAFAQADGTMKALTMPHTIEIVMLTAGALIIMLCKPDGTAITRGSDFHAGMRAAMAIFGVAWLGDTLFNAHLDELKTLVSGLVETAPWTFAFALFAFSVLVNSQGATVATLFPLGVSLGIPPEIMVGTFVAVNGYFFIPNYGPIIASIDFDTTGTTRIGRYILNH
ncbi:anaerobic C4-dicarboxylate transporter, partial [Cardiobacterium hominis]|uniref:anaerobic C4-dicarboxylate transporter n=1 Tax=Cardiobacterium hominis TaxID=2718 RepID=UPI0028892573